MKQYEELIATIKQMVTDGNVSQEVAEKYFPELKESEDKEKPNGGIVLEDFNEGDGFYKVNLAYLSKEQVEEIENIVKKWNPELKESEDEKIRKSLVEYLHTLPNHYAHNGICAPEWLAWLEKQSKRTNWKPSKEEMDVLYGLAYITNQYDEHKEEVITRLYQNLKREFFNGSSYENMFPNTEDGVRRRSTIQVLEYARSLDNYNQYGKADIDKNIAWLEKQGDANKEYWRGYREGKQEILDKYAELEKQGQKPQGKSALDATQEENVDNQNCVKPADNVEPIFKVGQWIVKNDGKDCFSDGSYVLQITDVDGIKYKLSNGCYLREPFTDTYRLWTIRDAKDGDVLCTYECCEPKIVFILKGTSKKHYALSYHCYYNIMYPHFASDSEKGCLAPKDEDVKPATKEQRDLLFEKMHEARYEWDAEKKELEKIDNEEVNGEDYGIDGLWHAQRILEKTLGSVDGYQSDDGILDHKAAITAVKKLYKQKPAWSEEDEKMVKDIIAAIDTLYYHGMVNWLKSLKDRVQPKQEWSDVDKDILFRIMDDLKFLRDDISKDTNYAVNIVDVEREIAWLKFLSPQPQWKPSDEQMKALEWQVNNTSEGSWQYEESKNLLEQLKKLKG